MALEFDTMSIKYEDSKCNSMRLKDLNKGSNNVDYEKHKDVIFRVPLGLYIDKIENYSKLKSKVDESIRHEFKNKYGYVPDDLVEGEYYSGKPKDLSVISSLINVLHLDENSDYVYILKFNFKEDFKKEYVEEDNHFYTTLEWLLSENPKIYRAV